MKRLNSAGLALAILMLVGCGGSPKTTKDEILNIALAYPPIKAQFDEKNSPCFDGQAPERDSMTGGYYCSRSFSGLIKSYEEANPEADNPAVYQTFKYLEDGSLNAVVAGFYNMFKDVNEAEEFLISQFNHLGLQQRHLKNKFYNEGGTSLRSDFSRTEFVPEWSRLQIAFGCKAVPWALSPQSKIPFDSPEYGKWQGVLSEFIGKYSWLSDSELGKFVDFEIYKDDIDKSAASRCVLATVIYGDREKASLSSTPRRVVEVVFAEVDSSFPITSKDFRD